MELKKIPDNDFMKNLLADKSFIRILKEEKFLENLENNKIFKNFLNLEVVKKLEESFKQESKKAAEPLDPKGNYYGGLLPLISESQKKEIQKALKDLIAKTIKEIEKEKKAEEVKAEEVKAEKEKKVEGQSKTILENLAKIITFLNLKNDTIQQNLDNIKEIETKSLDNNDNDKLEINDNQSNGHDPL